MKRIWGFTVATLILTTTANAVFFNRFTVREAREQAKQPHISLQESISRAAEVNSFSSTAALCHAQFKSWSCVRQMYRPASAQCSSLTRNRHDGKAEMPLNRWMPGNYSKFGQLPLDNKLPNPRKISMVLRAFRPPRLSDKFTELYTTLGQYFSHDMSLTPDAVGKACTPVKHACFRSWETNMKLGCRPIYNEEKKSCIPMKRSATLCDKVSPVNEATSFIDASPVYGSNLKDMKLLRNGHRLRVNNLFKDLNGMAYLPFLKDRRETCAGQHPCFLAGDRRASVAPLLAMLHTIFMREHNRIADHFKSNTHVYFWTDDRIFAETRKIIEAMHQQLAYEHYLPHMVGRYLGSKINRDWTVRNTPSGSSNAFTHAAFRLAHCNINPMVRLRFHKGAGMGWRNEDRPIHHHFWRPDKIIQMGMDAIINGVQHQRMKDGAPHNIIAKPFTEHLFTEKLNGVAADLLALDIARGRDVGLKPYLHWRRFCRLPRADSWKALRRIWMITDKQFQGVKNLYVDPGSVDLFLGGMIEKPIPGALVGPTFRCLIGRQFLLTKNHDYYFYLRYDQRVARVLYPVKPVLMAHLLCRNSGIKEVRRNPFLVDSPIIPCRSIPSLDLSQYLAQSSKRTVSASTFDDF